MGDEFPLLSLLPAAAGKYTLQFFELTCSMMGFSKKKNLQACVFSGRWIPPYYHYCLQQAGKCMLQFFELPHSMVGLWLILCCSCYVGFANV